MADNTTNTTGAAAGNAGANTTPVPSRASANAAAGSPTRAGSSTAASGAAGAGAGATGANAGEVGSDADSLQEVAGLSGAKLRNAEYSAAAEVAIAMKQADDLQAFRVAKRKGRGKNTRGTHLEVAGMQVPFGHALIVTADEAAKLQDADLGDYEWHAE